MLPLEQEIFQRQTVQIPTLVPFGFVPTHNGYVYTAPIMGGQFTATVAIDPQGNVQGWVTDSATDEVYAPLHLDVSAGAFVGEVRDAYRQVLRRIADACCTRRFFLSPQANRLADAISAQYGETPDFPFATAPTYGVFRYPPNRKWYGLIMDIAQDKLMPVSPDALGGDIPKIEIINLKIRPDQRDALLAHPAIFPGYHMNRINWISVWLNDTLPFDALLSLVDASRALVVPANKPAPKGV